MRLAGRKWRWPLLLLLLLLGVLQVLGGGGGAEATVGAPEAERAEVPRKPAAAAWARAMIDDRFAGSMAGAASDRFAGADKRGPREPPNQPPEAGNQRRRRRRSAEEAAPAAATTTTGAVQASQPQPLKCRVEKDLYLDFEEYKHYSCAICYNNMAESVFTRKLLFLRQTRVWLYDKLTERYVLPNETSFLAATFKKESTASMWLYCCQQALDCCRRNWAQYLTSSSSAAAALATTSGSQLRDPPQRDFCPATWDGLECWPNTPAGRTLEHPCPDHVYFLSFVPVCSGSVRKQCFSNASWFIRNNHEWSNFTNCAPLPLYETRMLIGSIWNIVSALVVGPSLLIFSKLPNRGGSKRVQILQNLLLWVLIYYLFEATHKIGVITKVFRLGTEPNDAGASRPRLHHSSSLFTGTQAGGSPSSPSSLSSSSLSSSSLSSSVIGLQHSGVGAGDASRPRQRRAGLEDEYVARLGELEDRLRANSARLDLDYEPNCSSANHCSPNYLAAAPNQPQVPQESATRLLSAADSASSARPPDIRRLQRDTGNAHKLLDNISSTALDSRDVLPPTTTTTTSQQRLTSAPANNQKPTAARQSTFITLACWTVSLGVRITRQLGYAWMFAGAIYLCSVLHFAPAEPPPSFIRWLMILTNVIPLTIGLVYLIVRSIYEPSPLVLLFKLPYFYAIKDSSTVEHLKESQADCWMFRSSHDTIEQITEFPNLILVILNSGLFIVTLTIMCRINRPGSTRQEMSLSHYFKAAGTLVLLYGAHYTLLAGLPNVDKKRSQDPNGCIKAQLGYYAFQFVDNIQGILVSYVFCYKTQEGREVISKWWSSWRSNESQWLRLGSGRNKSARISRDYILPSSRDKNAATRSVANEKEASFMDSGTKIDVCEF